MPSNFVADSFYTKKNFVAYFLQAGTRFTVGWLYRLCWNRCLQAYT